MVRTKTGYKIDFPSRISIPDEFFPDLIAEFSPLVSGCLLFFLNILGSNGEKEWFSLANDAGREVFLHQIMKIHSANFFLGNVGRQIRTSGR
jgi:hypothetical protein